MSHPFDVLIDSYLDNNIGIDAGFLNERLSAGLQQNIQQFQQHDLMTEHQRVAEAGVVLNGIC